MLRKAFPLYRLLLASAALNLFAFAGSGASPETVARLQESYGATPADRRAIYNEVISSVGESGADSLDRLARAVALIQLAMDLEDEYIERMAAVAPNFSGLAVSDPPFFKKYALAVQELTALRSSFPITAEYAAGASLITRKWGSGPELFTASLEFRKTWPASRFSPRLLLLSGCRLLLEKKYSAAHSSFETLWNSFPENGQAASAYRLVDRLNGAGGLALTLPQRLAWGRSQGLGGHSTLVKLFERHLGAPESELACIQIFKNFNQGFASRSLSTNRRLSDLMEKYYAEFGGSYPFSPYLQQLLSLRAEFNYRCGKKCEAIARKNEHLGLRTKSRRRRNTGDRYSSLADGHFQRVREADSTATALFPLSKCYFETGLYRSMALFEVDDYEAALSRLKALLAAGPESEMQTRIGSYTGLIYYFRGEYGEAAKVMAGLETEKLALYEGWSRAMLFLGKAQLALGDSSSAARVLTRLARFYPYTYFGIRARRLKSGLFQGTAAPAWIVALPALELPVFPDSFSRAGNLIDRQARDWQTLGFFAEAAYTYSYGVSHSPGDLLLRFRLHQNFKLAGWYQRVLINFRGPFNDFLQRGGTGLPADFWDIAYLSPVEYNQLIKEEGARRKIPPALITAVIRQESNFNARARSHAGALGLMQLLPSVGRNLARGAGLGKVGPSSLFQPDINVKLGVKYLANQLAKYQGNIALAISCYNAAPQNLPAWLDRSHPEGAGEEVFDPDLFIEMIPLEETYFYNIQVLTNFWRYQELNGEQNNLFYWKLSSF